MYTSHSKTWTINESHLPENNKKDRVTHCIGCVSGNIRPQQMIVFWGLWVESRASGPWIKLWYLHMKWSVIHGPEAWLSTRKSYFTNLSVSRVWNLWVKNWTEPNLRPVNLTLVYYWAVNPAYCVSVRQNARQEGWFLNWYNTLWYHTHMKIFYVCQIMWIVYCLWLCNILPSETQHVHFLVDVCVL